MKAVFFDIETGPVSDEQMEKLKPAFKAPGNYKDPLKIAANIVEQETAWKQQAALDPTIGQILCCGIYSDSGYHCIENRNEEITVRAIIQWLEQFITQPGYAVIGFNIFSFDLPFILRRAWINGINSENLLRRDNYWHDAFRDLLKIWCCGNREQGISLDLMARSFGVGRKEGTGASFAKLWNENRQAAMEYQQNEMNLLRACSAKILGTAYE